MLELVPALESHGFDGATFPDHLFLPHAEPGRYPYSADGMPPFGPGTPWLDPLVIIGALGPLTKTLSLTTAVYVLPARHPVVVAKAVSTASRLCGGRLSMGVGVGWQREEFDVLGVDFTRRGALMDDAIPALRSLLGTGVATHDGGHYAFPPLVMEPSPAVPVPILVGGYAEAAVRRAVRLGDGYFMPTTPLDKMQESIGRVRTMLDEGGRDSAGFDLWAPFLGATAEEIVPLLDPLVTDVTVMPWPHPGKLDTTVEEKLRHLESYAQNVLAAIR